MTCPVVGGRVHVWLDLRFVGYRPREVVLDVRGAHTPVPVDLVWRGTPPVRGPWRHPGERWHPLGRVLLVPDGREEFAEAPWRAANGRARPLLTQHRGSSVDDWSPIDVPVLAPGRYALVSSPPILEFRPGTLVVPDDRWLTPRVECRAVPHLYRR